MTNGVKDIQVTTFNGVHTVFRLDKAFVVGPCLQLVSGNLGETKVSPWLRPHEIERANFIISLSFPRIVFFNQNTAQVRFIDIFIDIIYLKIWFRLSF